MEFLKLLVQRAANRVGYEIVRKSNHVSPEPEVAPRVVANDLALYYQLYPRESVEQRRFFNIGAGQFKHEAWTNVDHVCDWYNEKWAGMMKIDIDFDLLSLGKLPIDSGTAEVVYCAHTIEHITNGAVQNLLNEAFHILKPNGYLRVVTPDTDLIYKAWICNNDSTFLPEYIKLHSGPNFRDFALNRPLDQTTNIQRFLHITVASACELHSDSPARRISDAEFVEVFNRLPYEEALDYCVSRSDLPTQQKYVGNHINWFNEHKLTDMVRKAGFQDIYRSASGQSLCPVLRDTKLFDTHPEFSLFVEARKK